jgi:DNA-binding GntR family transcriptional regulator
MSDIMPLMPPLSRVRQPLFIEVREQLVADLEARYQPGDRLAAEPDLATAYGVSRPTMREVLRTLESDGLVQRVHGVGTFVTRTETAVTSRFDLDLGVTEAVVAANRKLDIQILRIAPDHAPPDVAERLEIPLGAPLLAVERVIRADAVPAAHALDVIPGAVLDAAGAASYEGGSVYQFLEERCGLELAGGIADVTATNAGRGLARQLGVAPGTALLRMEQVERTAGERAVLYSCEHYVPSVFNLSVRRIRRRGPASSTTS